MTPHTMPASSVSRRAVLTAAVGAGVAAAAVAVTTVGAPAAASLDATETPHDGVSGVDGPVVVHVRNAATGDMDVFSGTERRQIKDAGLALRISQAASTDR